MRKEEFIDILRNERKLKDFFFVIVSQSDDEMSVVCNKRRTQQVVASFRYSETGIVYRFYVNDASIYEIKDLINTIYDICERG